MFAIILRAAPRHIQNAKHVHTTVDGWKSKRNPLPFLKNVAIRHATETHDILKTERKRQSKKKEASGRE